MHKVPNRKQIVKIIENTRVNNLKNSNSHLSGNEFRALITLLLISRSLKCLKPLQFHPTLKTKPKTSTLEARSSLDTNP